MLAGGVARVWVWVWKQLPVLSDYYQGAAGILVGLLVFSVGTLIESRERAVVLQGMSDNESP